MLAAGLVWQGSLAAFTASTTNAGNSFAAGTVSLTDDDAGSALFTVGGLKPGSTGQNCITVDYGGTLAADVRLYVAPGDLTDSGLAPYLQLTVQEGSGGSFGSCAGFTPAATDFSGTLAGFAATAVDPASGVGTFAPAGANQSRVYRFSWTLADDNAAQGGTAAVTFSWNAANT